MEDKDKNIAAAIAAVSAYMQEEQAAALSAAQQRAGLAARTQEPPGFVRPWALNGRQAMMQMRNLMQLRTFARW